MCKMSPIPEGLCPALTADVCEKLRRAKVKTVLDFVQTDPEELARKSNVNFRDIALIRKVLLAKYSALPRSGIDLLDEMLASRALFSTGCEKLDVLLEGGVLTGEIMEVTGPPASGKTQFCLAVAVQVTVVNKKAVLYIDTSGGFSSQRIQEMLEARGLQDLATNLQADLFRYSFVPDIFHLFSLIDKLKVDLDTQKDTFHTSLRVIVIDSVTSLLGPIFGGKQLEGHGLMVQLAQSLNYLCAEYSVATIVTNNTVQDNLSSQLLKPALGQYWHHVPSIRLLMQRTEGTTQAETRRVLTVLKSGRTACGQSVIIAITNKGIA